jgi:hypothetical protein
MTWHLLKLNDHYEINNKYPYPIREKESQRVIAMSEGSHGYFQVILDGKRFLKHRIIAYQWLPNDDPTHKIQVDHKDRNRHNNHVENLHWTTVSTNMFNRTFKKHRKHA